MNWYFKVLNHYADFNGRARRKEFWMFVLVNFIIAWILNILDRLIGFDYMDTGYSVHVGVLYTIYFLFIIIPSVAVGVRRLHDIGKSGWWYLIIFIPLVGPIWLFILWITDSQQGTNEYGPNPKGIDEIVE